MKFATAEASAAAFNALKGRFFSGRMIAEGCTGRKGKGGFYRLNTSGGAKVKESVNLVTGDYSPSDRARLESADAAKGGLKTLVEHKDKGGQYAWKVLSGLLSYAASLVPEIADDVVAVELRDEWRPHGVGGGQHPPDPAVSGCH